MATKDRPLQDKIAPISDELLSLEELLAASEERDIQKTSSKAVINQLPVELLVHIFALFIGRRHTTVIGTLLFVCRHWYNLVNSTAVLWSVISLRPERFTKTFLTLRNFVSTAVHNSKEHLLDIAINLLWIPDSDPAVFQARTQSFSGEGEQISLCDWLEDLLLCTVGHKGEIMQRWRTFELQVDYAIGTLPPLGEILVYATPNLREIRLHLNNALVETNLSYSMPDISALHTLVLDALGNPLDFVSSDKNILTLCIYPLGNVGLIETLGSFQNVRCLTVDFSSFYPPMEHQHEDDIHLTCLDTFTILYDALMYHFPAASLQKFKSPKLRTLRLIGQAAIFEGLNATSFYHIQSMHLVAETHSEYHRYSNVMGLSFLDRHLRYYTALIELVVAPWHLGEAMETLRYLRAKGEAPASLSAISTLVGERGGEALVHDVDLERLMVAGKPMEEYAYISHAIPLS